MSLIITIGRQFGSGGRDVGEKVAEYFNIPFYDKELVELAWENARMVLEKDRERIRREEGRTIGAVHEVEEWLGLSGIRRMEAYDISNISGL